MYALARWSEKQPLGVCLVLAREVTEVSQQNRRCGGEGEFMLVGLFLVASPCGVLGGRPPCLWLPLQGSCRPVLEALGQEKLVELPQFPAQGDR